MPFKIIVLYALNYRKLFFNFIMILSSLVNSYYLFYLSVYHPLLKYMPYVNGKSFKTKTYVLSVVLLLKLVNNNCHTVYCIQNMHS